MSTDLNNNQDIDAFARDAVEGTGWLRPDVRRLRAAYHSNQQPNSSPDADMAGELQDGNEAVSSLPALTFINPHCQYPDTCKWVHSQASCSVCANDAMRARAAS
ncbi:hypothetical protein ACFPLB_04160 [Aquamicrobium segne]|uniref:C3H1-type domain-containing protein n=1 Tax=Aquamicrobium segne TaxID=469547 RepID=A0ABW0GZI0_9HYPH